MKLILDCPNCDARTQAEELKSTTFNNHHSDEGIIDASYRCTGCGLMFVTRCIYNLYDPRLKDEWAHEFGVDTHQILRDAATWWPRPSSSPYLPHVPPHVMAVTDEAYKCFDSECYAAAVVMARAAIEAMAKDKGAPAKSDLHRKIMHLREGGMTP